MNKFVLGIGVALAALVHADATPSFQARAAAYLEGLPEDVSGEYGAVARLAVGHPISLKTLRHALEVVDRRNDCADFRVAGLVRLMYLFGDASGDKRGRQECPPHTVRLSGDAPGMPPDVYARVRETLLGFKYWMDEPGDDSMCYWSENHQILFHSAEYLVGNRFADAVFATSGMTGAAHRDKGKRLVERWLGWRERFGFSEWLSNDYFAMDTMALTNLVDFAPDAAIARRAALALDQLALNMALNSYRGYFTCTHGRTYEENTQSAAGDNVKQIMYLLWGVREYTPDLRKKSNAGIALATSTYRLPAAIEAIGKDTDSTFENRQHVGIAPEDLGKYGVSGADRAAGVFLWGMGAYGHPVTLPETVGMWRDYHLWNNRFFHAAARPSAWLYDKGLLTPLCRCVPLISEGAYLFDAHTDTYRTPDYILSSVQDWRPGEMGAQVLSWQAGLGQDAVVFTTYPAKVTGGSPGYWRGTATNPRIAQCRNVLVALYKRPLLPRLGELERHHFTHAWFPETAFDETAQRGHWFFGRKGQGYIALYSLNPAQRIAEGEFARKEIVADGPRNAWICEMGREAEWGGFDAFVEAVASATVAGDIHRLRYVSPSLGEVTFGWTLPFTVAGAPVELHNEMRYDNPFVHAARDARAIAIAAGGQTYTLDFDNTK